MTNRFACVLMGMTIAIASSAIVLSQDLPATPAPNEAAPPAPPTLPEARRQAELLHSVVHSTLQNVHHDLYRNDEGLLLPAAVLLEVFDEVEQEQNVKLRWLAVEGQVMNADHKPRDSFEKDAVSALISGKRSFERVENGVYRRAGAITLGNACLKCHVPDRRSLEDRTAGLIIAIPISSP